MFDEYGFEALGEMGVEVKYILHLVYLGRLHITDLMGLGQLMTVPEFYCRALRRVPAVGLANVGFELRVESDNRMPAFDFGGEGRRVIRKHLQPHSRHLYQVFNKDR